MIRIFVKDNEGKEFEILGHACYTKQDVQEYRELFKGTELRVEGEPNE
jgi:hypothetical protein